MSVKYLRKETIEAASRRLLLAYHERFGPDGYLPIPVEEILESHLGLSLEFDDLRRRLGVADVLGATWVRERRVVIDQSLDPTVDARKEGRYRFTIAHELGHWELHRYVFEDAPGQKSLFEHDTPPSIVCRTASRKDPMEWQADAFAGYLLMPRKVVTEVWESIYGTLEPYRAADEFADLAQNVIGDAGQPVVGVAREVAREFRVSGMAMQIRLMEMGLIIKKKRTPPFCGRNDFSLECL
ncbi:MAG: ImmA/IrrE family metallo-endopeptidase [Magnetococcales bacterium]|nr:ImmA/IrrE family metallo-endopeptidase [Magnetococcales bacterium]